MINIHSNENSDARKHWSVREHGPCVRKGCEKSYGCGNGAVREHGAVREKRYGCENWAVRELGAVLFESYHIYSKPITTNLKKFKNTLLNTT
jgi:hypothetical protein